MRSKILRLLSSGLSDLRGDVGHLHVLTGIRGWAALWVFMYHAWSFAKHPDLSVDLFGLYIDLTPIFSMGIAGVTIFFVLSGFLLATPFAQWQAGQRQRPRLGRYYYKRVMRVVPAYYFQLLMLVLLAYWVSGQLLIQDLGTLARHLLMLFMPPPVGVEPYINGVWWTLPIEFGFYLILPFLAFMFRLRLAVFLLLGCLIAMYLWRHGVVMRLVDAPLPIKVQAAYQLPGSMDAFGFGMVAAILHANRTSLPAWLLPDAKKGILGVLGITLVLVAIYWLPGRRADYWSDNFIFYAWTPALSLGISAVLLAGASGNRLMLGLFGNRYLVFVGLVSYSLYLWHLPVLVWLSTTSMLPGLAGAGLHWILIYALGVSMLVATISYLCIERPFMRMRN